MAAPVLFHEVKIMSNNIKANMTWKEADENGKF